MQLNQLSHLNIIAIINQLKKVPHTHNNPYKHEILNIR